MISFLLTKELSVVLGQWKFLQKLDLKSNPCTQKPKYRDRVITMSQSMSKLTNNISLTVVTSYFAAVLHDGKEISETERQFLLNWKLARRRQRKLLAAAAAVSQKKNGIPTAKEILQLPPPPTMPAMPARKPVK